MNVSFKYKKLVSCFCDNFPPPPSLVTRDTVLKSSKLDLFNGVSLVTKLGKKKHKNMKPLFVPELYGCVSSVCKVRACVRASNAEHTEGVHRRRHERRRRG
jgi:hypothetical protein